MFLISRLLRYIFCRAPKTVNTTDIGSRRALLVGITYKDLQDKLSETYPDVKESLELPGAHKDPLTIRKLLIGENETIP